MRVVAEKARGSRKIVAPRPPAAMTADAFAEAFGARALGTLGDDTNPFSLLQLRDELERRLRSNGGRPSLADVTEKWKVGVLQEDIQIIKALSHRAEVEHYKVSPAQIVTVLVHMALARFSANEIDDTVKHTVAFGR